MVVALDFETRSTADLRRCGVYRYAECPDTDVWCMAYAIDGGDVQLWTMGETVPEDFAQAVAQGADMRAWNAQFERVIYHAVLMPRYGFPPIPLERWYCTAAEGAAMSLPRSLGEAAKALGVAVLKDEAGGRVMMQMARPRAETKTLKGLHWWDTPEKLAVLYEYCKQDVRAETAVAAKVRRLSPSERAVYLHDQRFNTRGLCLDRELVAAATDVAAVALARANDDVRSMTAGAVAAVTKVQDIRAHLSALGVETPDLAKSTVADLLAGELPDDARLLLEARADAARTSVTKLKAMQDAVCEDGKLRGLTLYHGASTGRDTGKLVQPHNFPRGSVANVEDFIPDVLARDIEALALFHSPLSIISSMLRAMLTASPGNRLIAGDFSAIEARVVNWLFGQQDVIDNFRAYDAGDKTRDQYVRNAMILYNLPFEKIEKLPHRHTGKFQELGCGFGMGADAAVENAWQVYQLRISPEMARRIVDGYRATHPKVKNGWRELGDAALAAVRNPGQVIEVADGKLRLSKRGSFLWMVLPSGRLLCYAHPKIVERALPARFWPDPETPVYKPAVQCMGLSSYSKKWEPVALYGGLLTENAVQAIARDLLVDARLRLEAAGYPVVLSVHDEIIADVPCGTGSAADFTDIMRAAPGWADGLPVAVEAWEGFRYRK